MNAIQIVIAIIAVIAMLKAVWILATPLGFQRFAGVWLRVASRLPTLLPIALAVVGLALWGIILVGQPLYVTLVAVLGALYIWAASLYAKPDRLTPFVQRVVLDRSPAVLRLMAAATLVVAALVLWIALTGR